ncbi:MAG: hypothetical protein J0H34_12645 [Rhizobiales bacterium]|nr:hypothetical protein [Hyphomicrobiales bacterium]
MSDDDFTAYLHEIAHIDLPLEAKIELLRVLEAIMQSFVDRAFGEDAVQLARKGGDEIQITRDGDSMPMVALEDHNNTGDMTLTGAFEQRAGRENRKENC